MTAKQGKLKESWILKSKYGYKCYIFEAVNLTLHGHYTHVYRFQSNWHNTKNKTCLQDKEYMCH